MDNKLPPLTQMMSQLIALPSISSAHAHLDQSNQAVIELLATWAESIGFNIEIQKIDQSNKYNLIASAGSGQNGLMLSGHTDTVPYDETQWTSDPFKLTHKDNKFYGLGSCDMKSFIAMALEASQTVDFKKLKRPLILCATANEETDMSGARWLKDNFNHHVSNCIIGEPTELIPIVQHKGILMESITFLGQAGHSSDPDNGNSALEGMIDFINALRNYREDLQNKHQNPAFAVPVPTMNFGHIHGGDNPNRICAKCQCDIDIRFLPGMKLENLRDSIQQIAFKVANNRGLKVQFDLLFNGIPALETDANSEITQYLETISHKKSQTVAFGTEAPYFSQMNIDTMIFGPGSIQQAHQANEYVADQQIDPTIDALRKAIKHFCL
ncbi:MAG: acetylornithine deacetylase [Gammaproteobacteria bacterium]|nr:acetylornithine deacetylase [Gammaproteobacteria bacterium]